MTVFLISQRVSTVRNSDQIIVLDDGQVAGIGTHAELYRSCPVYHEICLSQLSQEEAERSDDATQPQTVAGSGSRGAAQCEEAAQPAAAGGGRSAAERSDDAEKTALAEAQNEGKEVQ